MSSRPLLEGRPEDRQQQDDAVRLRREITGLEQELQAAKDEAATAKAAAADAVQAIRGLRLLLEPWHKGLRMIFGEISRVDAGAIPTSSTSSPASPAGPDPRWDSWKVKLGGRLAEMIDVLLEHGGMTRPQLAAAMHCHPDTISQIAHKLSKSGLLTKNGGKFVLREL